jgi:hypothetical protein
MPLVKGIQEKYGKDKFQVLMLSVDLGYDFSMDKSLQGNAERLQAQGVDWPNVLLPKGFDDTQRLFHIDGYGLTLVGPDGLVKGVNIRPEDIDRLMG